MSYIRALRLGAAAVAILGFSLSEAHAETLKQALSAAYAHNPSINAALTSVKIASEAIALAKAKTRPVLGLGGNLQDQFAFEGGGFGHQASTTVGLNYSQTLYDNHATDANVEQARANVEASKQALRATESTVMLSAVQAYMNVILYTQLVQLRTDTVQFFQSQVKAAQDKQNIGEGTKIDVAEAQASLASAVAQQQAATASLQTAQAAYVHYIGHKPHNLSSDFNYGNVMPASIDRAVALAAANNPQVLAAKAAIRAASAAADAAAAASGPTVSATGQVGPSLSTTCAPSCTGATPSFGGLMKLSFSLPVYGGGAIGAQQRQADLGKLKSDLDAQSALATATDTAVSAWTALQNTAAQITSANAAVSAFQLALDGVIQERDVGQKTTLDVLNAESTLITYKESLITANASRVTAAFTLIAAIGRMSPKDLALNAAPKSATRYTQMVEDTWEDVRTLEPLPRPAWRN
jgi:outer membrane protein